MSKPSRVRTLTLLLAALGTTLALSAGCAKQSEGERCSPVANNDLDCEDGLWCRPGNELGIMGEDDFGRCCPFAGEPIGDSRCIPRTGGGSGGNGSGGSGTGGGSTEGGSGTEGGSTSATGGTSSEGGSSSGGATSTGGSDGA